MRKKWRCDGPALGPQAAVLFRGNWGMWVMDGWRLDYNQCRGHGARDDQTPAAFVADCVQWLKNI